jgi:hypothetical protein
MVNNSTNINKTNNYLSPSSLNSDGQQFHQYLVNNSTNINKANNHLSLSSLNSDGQQFHQYQQNKQPPLTFKFKQ